MKTPVFLLAAALLLPMPGAVSAAPAGTSLLTDPAGDVKTFVNDNDLGNPTNGYPDSDLRSLSLEEQEEAFVLRVEVADLASESPTGSFLSQQIFAGFRFVDRDYRVTVQHGSGIAGQTFYVGYLSVYDSGLGRFQTIGSLLVMPEDTTVMAVTVPRDALATSKGDVPSPGHVLEGFYAESHVLQANFGRGGPIPAPSLDTRDQMPDGGVGTGSFTVKFGVEQVGDIRLDSPLRFRASNGGNSDTIVYQVEIQNLGEAAHRLHLSVSGGPPGWKISLPTHYVDIEPDSKLLIPVLLQTPSGHTHGTTGKFLVEAHSETDGTSVGRIEMGLRYSDPPQPAGHHPKLWFHTRNMLDDQVAQALGTVLSFDGVENYMNARDPKDEAEDEELVSYGYQARNGFDTDINDPTGMGPKQTWQWRIDLSPSLLLGLDVDVAHLGSVSIPIAATILPLVDAKLDGALIHYNGDHSFDPFSGSGPFNRPQGTPTTVGTFHADVGTINPQSGLTVQADFVPAAKADYIPFMDGSSLVLYVNLTSTYIQIFSGLGPNPGPTMTPGGSMVLPLLEYHDPVSDIFASASAITFLAEGAMDRIVNPGDAVLFNLTLANDGETEASLALNLTGENAAWARMFAGPEVTVAAGQKAKVPLAVRVPETAQQGDTADLVIQAVNPVDPTMRSLAHVFVTVDKETEHASDAAAVELLEAEHQPAKNTPAGNLVLVGLGLLVLALTRRRA